MAQRETSAQIEATAVDWVTRADHAALDHTEQAELDDWLAGDPRRLGAYARACAMFLHARSSKALGSDFDPDAFLASVANTSPSAGDDAWRPASSEPDEIEGRSKKVTRRIFLAGASGALAAGVLLTVGLPRQAFGMSYSTRRGEIRLVPLADGSTMTLNTASTARVHFSDNERRIELVTGEALFDVVGNSQSPFVVTTHQTTVRAVGTSFALRRLQRDPIEILLRGGVIEVEQAGNESSSERISASARILVPDNGPIQVTRVTTSDIARSLEWREGMLSFEDEPLRNAANEFARYSDTHIIVADPSIGDETVTGLFAANNPIGFARATAESLGLNIHTERGAVILDRSE